GRVALGDLAQNGGLDLLHGGGKCHEPLVGDDSAARSRGKCKCSIVEHADDASIGPGRMLKLFERSDVSQHPRAVFADCHAAVAAVSLVVQLGMDLTERSRPV